MILYVIYIYIICYLIGYFICCFEVFQVAISIFHRVGFQRKIKVKPKFGDQKRIEADASGDLMVILSPGPQGPRAGRWPLTGLLLRWGAKGDTNMEEMGTHRRVLVCPGLEWDFYRKKHLILW